MKRILSFVIISLVVVIVVGFAAINADSVQFNYYFGSIQLPLSLLIILVIAIGAFMGVLASLGFTLSKQRELTKLRKKVNLNEREIKNLREIPIRNKH